MSSKSECYSVISACESQISENTKEINILNQEVAELRETKADSQAFKTALTNAESRSCIYLRNKAVVNKIDSRLAGSYSQTMEALVPGTDFVRANTGLANAISVIQEEIQRRVNEIASLRSEITSCQGTIREMRAEIARIEAEEERERERQRELERERERERERSSSSSGPGVSSNGPASAGKNYSGPASAKGPGYQ